MLPLCIFKNHYCSISVSYCELLCILIIFSSDTRCHFYPRRTTCSSWGKVHQPHSNSEECFSCPAPCPAAASVSSWHSFISTATLFLVFFFPIYKYLRSSWILMELKQSFSDGNKISQYGSSMAYELNTQLAIVLAPWALNFKGRFLALWPIWKDRDTE